MFPVVSEYIANVVLLYPGLRPEREGRHTDEKVLVLIKICI